MMTTIILMWQEWDLNVGNKRGRKGGWTPDEHRRFLVGLKVYGKGDWHSISREMVVSRTPTQIASHAQKYFLRQNAEKKRRCIYDITITDAPPAIAFYGGQGRGVPAPSTPAPSPPGGQGGGGAQSPLTPAPVSFYAGDGASSPPTLQPTNFYWEGQGVNTKASRFSVENQFNSSMDQENKSTIQSPPVVLTWPGDNHWLFLHALANVPNDIAGRWQKIADGVPGRTAEEVKAYHDAWEDSLKEIMAAPHHYSYDDDDDEDDDSDDDDDGDDVGVESSVKFKKGDKSVVSSGSELKTGRIDFGAGAATGSGSKRGREIERKKPTQWTVEEHRRFLEGLKIYGKGDWRGISRNVVVTRSSTQVASHAQKYFLRQNLDKKAKKRASIHDITTTDAAIPKPPDTRRGVPAPTDFYGGQLGQSPLTAVPVNFCVGEGGAPPPLMGNDIQQNFIYYPY
ncbi:hypothetical protein L1987_34906 [Smallanthus sonchifolius]|uniref:Uncharacterized protein n=1 Tax=Smallanthus sonchifolius TaxID=185202 RepID=A0ACB9HVJ4_9ASTR|nr:hypothetical protein L1987_34906 [Smallanthus sonchifolius]